MAAEPETSCGTNTAMELEKLLKRIKAEDVKREATLETLKRLCMCFVSNIPFETTDMYGGKTKIWDLKLAYDNIVVKNRGGFCCDLNGLLQWVLKEFGFKVELLKAYVCENNDTFLEVSDHMALMVTVENGEKYVADVGWGGSCFALPLEMKIGVDQSQPNGVYRLGEKCGMITVEKKKQRYLKIEEDIIKFENERQRSAVVGNDGGQEEWNIQFGFKEIGYDLSDFQQGHDYAQFQNLVLQRNMLVVLQNEKGRKFFVNNLFYEKEYIDPETIKLKRFKKCTIDEMYPILEEEFDLKLDFELKLKTFVE